MKTPINNRFITSLRTLQGKSQSAEPPRECGDREAADLREALSGLDRALERTAQSAEFALNSVPKAKRSKGASKPPVDLQAAEKVASKMNSLVELARKSATTANLHELAEQLASSVTAPTLQAAYKLAFKVKAAPRTKGGVVSALIQSIKNAHIDSLTNRGGG